MKRIIRALVKKNQRLEQLLHLTMWVSRSVQTRGLWGTSSYLLNLWNLNDIRRRKNYPEGYPHEQIPSRKEARRQIKWEATGDRPKIFLVVPVIEDSPKALNDTVQSVLVQSYSHWSLSLLVEDTCCPELSKAIRFLKQRDARVCVNPGVGSMTKRLNQTIASTDAEYMGVIKQGDRLTLDALFHFAKNLEQTPSVDVLYCDDVHVEQDLNQVSALILKPEWSPEQLLSYNYIGDFFLIHRSMWQELEGYREDCESTRNWDLLLRLSESGALFQRVPRCLTLRTSNSGRPTGTATAETYCQFQQTLKDALDRRGIPASSEYRSNGTHRLNWNLSSPPSVSVILLKQNEEVETLTLVNRLLDEMDDLTEIIIVNVSTKFEKLNDNASVRIVSAEKETSMASAWNLGARYAKGEYLLFLDSQVIGVSDNWIEELVGWAVQKEVGIVSPQLASTKKIDYPTLITLMESPIPSSMEDWNLFGTGCYRNSLLSNQHCQLITHALFKEVGGFDESYRGTLASSELALKVWSKGYRIVTTPFVKISLRQTYHDVNPVEDEELLAQEVRRCGVMQSPYSHPLLSSQTGDPKLRLSTENSAEQITKRLLNHLDPQTEHATAIHWFDDSRFQEQVDDMGVQLLFPSYVPDEVATCQAAATQFILHVLLTDRDVRNRFPLALSEFETGGFCKWLCDEGLSRYRIPNSEDASANIRRVFQVNPGSRVRQLLAFRSDIIEKLPTAFLSMRESWLLGWMLTEGRSKYQLQDAQIWWFMLEARENPVRELEWIYQTSPDWQHFIPAGLTPFGCEKLLSTAIRRHGLPVSIVQESRKRWSEVTFEGLKLAYSFRIDWQISFSQAFQDPKETQQLLAWLKSNASSINPLATIPAHFSSDKNPTLGLNVLGHFCSPSGLQQSTKFIVRSLKQLGVPISCRDVSAHFDLDDTDRSEYLDFETHDVSLIHVQPSLDRLIPYEEISYKRAGLASRPNIYRIGMWYWELEDIPSTWRNASETVDELWAPTTFIGDAIRKTLPIKVTNTLPGVQLGEVESVSRQSLGISDDEFLFLFMFDMKSIMERKNPIGLIESFKKAFRKGDKAKLIIKVASGHFNPKELARLKSAADRAGVKIIDELLPRAQAYGLIEACDAYVSLHRSEGLGLTMAEAMLMAKPVIATNYSGNVDFMDSSCSCLVDYDLRQLKDNCPDYVYSIYSPESVWAHASTEHAAHWMRWTYENQDEARQMGLAAKAHTDEKLSLQAAGLRMKTRLEEIYAERNACSQKSATTDKHSR